MDDCALKGEPEADLPRQTFDAAGGNVSFSWGAIFNGGCEEPIHAVVVTRELTTWDGVGRDANAWVRCKPDLMERFGHPVNFTLGPDARSFEDPGLPRATRSRHRSLRRSG